MRDKKQLTFPMGYDVKTEKDEPVRKNGGNMRKLRLHRIAKSYVRDWRKTSPITLFPIGLLGYMTGNFSSRKIEQAYKTDIRFMWILEGEEKPDHSTIARFQNERLTDVIEDLFYQFANKLMEMGEIGYENVFIDGTKIEANANANGYSFVWKKSVESNMNKLK